MGAANLKTSNMGIQPLPKGHRAYCITFNPSLTPPVKFSEKIALFLRLFEKHFSIEISYGLNNLLYSSDGTASKEDADYIVEKVAELMNEKFPEEDN